MESEVSENHHFLSLEEICKLSPKDLVEKFCIIQKDCISSSRPKVVYKCVLLPGCVFKSQGTNSKQKIQRHLSSHIKELSKDDNRRRYVLSGEGQATQMYLTY